MELVGGKSYEDGIDFLVKDGKRKFIYSARRNACGDIETFISSSYAKVNTRAPWEYALCGIVTALFVLLILFFKEVENTSLGKLRWVLALTFFWLGFISFLYMQGKDKRNSTSTRYHAVEHKVLNFYQKYSYLPTTTEDIEKMSAIYIGCGSTLIIVIALFSTLATLSILLVPTILLKALCVAISGVIAMYCWANGKCNFAQKWLLKQPTYPEVELAVCAMHRLAKEQNVL
jgi:uncharacterized protein YqhQ